MEFNQQRRRFLSGLAVAGIAGAWPGFVIAEGFADKVVYLRPGDREYGNHTFLFNKRIKRMPALVAVCYTEEGVRLAVERARKEGLPVAVKGGGHSFEGFSLNEGGFVIDVSPMDAQRLASNGIYTAEPSCRLIQTYETIVPRGRLLPLGSCAMVGIAGLTLGGGYGLFSREHGLACDALRSLRIVDGRGEVHEVSEGSELFRACRGGGNGNFGVVTQLQFETVTAPKHLWRYLFKINNLDRLRATNVAKEWFDVAPQLPRTTFSAFVLNHKSLTILVTDTAEETPKALAVALSRLEKIADRRNPDRKEALQTGMRRYYGKLTPLYFKNASAGFYVGYEDISAIAPELFAEVIATPGLLYSIGTVGGAITELDDGTRTAYAHRQANFLGEVQSYWENPGDEQRLRNAVSRFQDRLSEHVRAHYCNYPDLAFKDWQSAYYGKTGYQRLIKVKQQYDPGNLFSYAQSVRA